MPGRDSGRFWRLFAITAAALPLCLCSRAGPAAKPEAVEATPPARVSADSFLADAALILEPASELPAPLDGQWQVATAGRTCSLTLVIDEGDLSGHTTGCSDVADTRPIAIGLASGGSFLFQTGRAGAGWIWSGRYDPAQKILQGRREHVITGELESFVARR